MMNLLKHIPMMVWMAWVSLKRDRVVLLLTFALPIAFFSIFVGIFGSSVTGGDGMSKVKVALVDLDDSANSQRFVRALKSEGGLNIITTMGKGEHALPMTRASAESIVKDGGAGVGLIIPKGFGATFPNFSFGADASSDEASTIVILADKQRDPIAPQVVAGLMQKAAMMGAPDLMIESGIGQFEKFAGGLTPEQQAAMDIWLPQLREQLDKQEAAASQPSTQPAADDASVGGAAGFDGLVKVDVVNVQSDHKSDWEAFVSFQVAQTAVMFLLFSMAGAAGSMLDEQENGTLERMLSSNVGMGGLLAGKWMVIALIGVAQLAAMFLWAWKPFGLNLFTPHHLAGWAIMSFATAAAGAGFGMVLATACRSRGQLSGFSTIIILTMSAVGGSMFPRFMMSEQLQTIGLCTFNAWALDGYRKVFYDNLPLTELWPQVSVLIGLAIAFMLIARLLARRWEAT